MCICQIEDVDVIADTSAIGSGIVSAKDGYVLPFSKCNSKCERDQVRLRFVRFAQLTGGTRGIEVTQACVAKSVDAMEPCEHLLHQQLGFSISVGRLERIIFLDGRADWITIQRGSGGKDELIHAVREQRFQERQRGG